MIKETKKSVNDVTDIWVYENFLASSIHSQIKNLLLTIKDNPRGNFEGRGFKYNNNNYKLLGTAHYRPYTKIWDLSHQPAYWQQTNDSFSNWASKQYSNLIPPIVRMLIHKILTVSPLTDGKTYVPVRGIFNILNPGVALDPHLDGEGFLSDLSISDVYSATYYVDVQGEGGEYWDQRGVFYKPKNNNLLINVGNRWVHGVRASDTLRLGITIRFYDVNDLILPGDVNQLLYKPFIANDISN